MPLIVAIVALVVVPILTVHVLADVLVSIAVYHIFHFGRHFHTRLRKPPTFSLFIVLIVVICLSIVLVVAVVVGAVVVLLWSVRTVVTASLNLLLVDHCRGLRIHIHILRLRGLPVTSKIAAVVSLYVAFILVATH